MSGSRPRIAIRVDAGAYGLGHWRRMRVLAEALAALGACVDMVTTTPGLGAPPTIRVSVYAGAPPGDPLTVRMCREADLALFDLPSTHARAICVGVATAAAALPTVLVDTYHLCGDVSMVLLPHLHTPPDILAALASRTRVLAGAPAVLLPELPPVVPFDDRDIAVACAAGGSPTSRLLLDAWATAACTRSWWPHAMLLYAPAHWPAVQRRFPQQCRPFSLEALARCRLLVAPLGQTVYEALALGTPVALAARTAIDARGCTQLVDRGLAFFPVCAADLDQAIGDLSAQRRLSETALSSALSSNTPRHVAAQILSLLGL